MKRSILSISLITLGCLYGLLSIIVMIVMSLSGVPIYFGLFGSIVVLVLQFLFAPFFTDLTMKWFYGARYGYQMPEYFNKFLDEICIKYQMQRPKIGYINDGAPNAFTYGRTKNDARIVLTRGIFELLTEEEVKAVVGHELGHIVHYDMAFMAAAQVIPLIMYYVYEMCCGRKTDKLKKNGKIKFGRGLVIIGYIAYVLYKISDFIVLWLSRMREYAADQFSIDETKNPTALADALVKIGYGLSTATGENIVDGKKKASAAKPNSLGIFDGEASKALVVGSYDNTGINKNNIKNAMKWEMWNIWAFFSEIHSTHPLMSKRLLAISKRCTEFNQNPYIVFDEVKPESYTDDFIIELIIRDMPLFSFIVGSGIVYYLYLTENENIIDVAAITLIISSISSLIKLKRRYRNKNCKNTTVSNLIGEVKVSNVTAIPCTLTGKIIGRGNPGCIFNEDFVIKDSTGIIFLDYKQPIRVIDKIFALFKSEQYFDKDVVVTGWYRRNPVPYIEIKNMIIDGKKKRCFTYTFSLLYRILYILFALFVLFLAMAA